jgi:hypothetical protein
VVKNDSVVSILRVLTKRGGVDEKTGDVSLRYVVDFFVDSDEVAVKLSKCATGNPFLPPCQGLTPLILLRDTLTLKEHESA